MTVIPNNFAQANIMFGGTACPTGAEITLGLDVSGTADDPETVATYITTQWVTEVQDALSEFCIHTGVLVKFGPNSTGPSAFVPNAAPGAVSNDCDVASVSILVRKNTALGGRAGRGRFFIPGASQDLFQEDSRMTSGDDLVYDALLGNFYDDLVGNDYLPVVLHSAGSPITTPTPITSFKTDPLAATQRRRLRR